VADKIPGATLPVTITTATAGNASGLPEYKFGSTADTKIYLSNVSGVEVVGGAGNDEFVLGTSTGTFITVGAGNDEFIMSAAATDLAGDVLTGDGGFNQVVFKGVGQTADLTKATYGVQSSGIDAVVGGSSLSGETVDLTLGQVLTTSLTGGISMDTNRAFIALIGVDGAVNLATPSGAKLVGVLNASGAGFDGSGNALSSAATATLRNEVTSIGNVAGTVARTFTGSTSVAKQTAALDNLDAYVFSTGSGAATTYETVWTDGTITATNTLGVATTYTQPTAATSVLPYGLGTVQILDTSDSHVTAALSTTSSGATEAQIGGGTIAAHDAITVGDVTGTVVKGDNGQSGGDYFNLAASGGGNTIIGSPVDDVFDIGASGALTDILQAGTGFNVVTDEGGGDVNLTAGGASGVADKGIQAAVGSATGDTTVEVDLSTLETVKTAGIFEAFLGSANSSVTVSASTGTWAEVGPFSQSNAASMGALSLTDANLLDTLFGATKSHNAETALTGYLFEQVVGTGSHEHVVKTVTLYTDATVTNATTPPPAAVLAQFMSQMGSPSASATTTATLAPAQQPSVLASSRA
jgi:hypothetical protein